MVLMSTPASVSSRRARGSSAPAWTLRASNAVRRRRSAAPERLAADATLRAIGSERKGLESQTSDDALSIAASRCGRAYTASSPGPQVTNPP